MPNVTVGTYIASQPHDSNVELRKLFTVRASQPDGLACILQYCQDKSGFRVDSTDVSGFLRVLKDEFWYILQQSIDPTAVDTSDTIAGDSDEYIYCGPPIADYTTISSVAAVEGIADGYSSASTSANIDFIFAHPLVTTKFDRFLASATAAVSESYQHTMIHFITHLKGDQLLLGVDSTSVYRSSTYSSKSVTRDAWVVDRDEMARRADELVAKIGLPQRIERWCMNITSYGY